MRKFVKDVIVSLPGLLAAVDRWGGRIMDLIGLPEAAKQVEAWRLEYVPDIGSGTYVLIAFSIIGVFLVHFWPHKESSAPHKERADAGKTNQNHGGDRGPAFVKIEDAKGVKLRNNVMVGDRTHIDMGRAEDVTSTGNIHLSGGGSLSGFIFLKDAAARLYSAARNIAPIAAAVSEFGDSDEDILNWWGTYMVHTKNTALFGIRPPATEMEMVASKNAQGMNIVGGAEKLVNPYSENDRYVGLCIKADDFKRLLENLEDEDE